MSAMIERVAETMWDCTRDLLKHEQPVYDMSWGKVGEYSKDYWRTHARKLLTAMREPTVEMIAALTQKREEHDLVVGVRWETATVVDIWQAGIDEALK